MNQQQQLPSPNVLWMTTACHNVCCCCCLLCMYTCRFIVDYRLFCRHFMTRMRNEKFTKVESSLLQLRRSILFSFLVSSFNKKRRALSTETTATTTTTRCRRTSSSRGSTRRLGRRGRISQRPRRRTRP